MTQQKKGLNLEGELSIKIWSDNWVLNKQTEIELS